MEECNEIAQRASKALRFGVDEIQPEQGLTNAERLIYEFNDLVAVMEMLHTEGHIPNIYDMQAMRLKKAKVDKFLTYSEECGTIDTTPN